MPQPQPFDLLSPEHIESLTRRAQPSAAGKTTTVLTGISDDDYRWLGAMHEAAHAVVALAVGLPLEWVRTDNGPVRRSFLAFSPAPAEATYTPFEGEPPVTQIGPFDEISTDRYFAFFAAGERASARWLASTGQLTPDTEADVAFLALSDRAETHKYTAPHGLPCTAGHDWADELLNRYWREVAQVTAHLRSLGRLTGDEVRAITGFGPAS